MKACLFLFLLQVVFISALPTSREDTQHLKRSNTSRTVSREDLKSLPQGIHIPLDLRNDQLQVTATVGVGSPPQNFTLVVDTGSGLTIIGGDNHKFIATNTTRLTGRTFNATFGTGFIGGIEVIEDATLAPGLTIANQSVGIISFTSPEISGLHVQGILGISPSAASRFDFKDNRQVPTVIDQAFPEGLVSLDIFGLTTNLPISFTNPADFVAVGELNLGGISTELFCGDMTFFPRILTPPTGLSESARLLLPDVWSIDSASLSIGGSSVLNNTPVIFDSGTALIGLPSEAFERYQTITGGRLDPSDGLLHYNVNQAVNFPSLAVELGGIDFPFPGLSQIAAGDNASDFIALVTNLGGIDIVDFVILGLPWFDPYYMAFDATRNEIGLATSINSPGGCPS